MEQDVICAPQWLSAASHAILIFRPHINHFARIATLLHWPRFNPVFSEFFDVCSLLNLCLSTAAHHFLPRRRLRQRLRCFTGVSPHWCLFLYPFCKLVGPWEAIVDGTWSNTWWEGKCGRWVSSFKLAAVANIRDLTAIANTCILSLFHPPILLSMPASYPSSLFHGHLQSHLRKWAMEPGATATTDICH